MSPKHESVSRTTTSFEALNESSPLLSAVPSPQDDDLVNRSSQPGHTLDWQEGNLEQEESKSTWYLFLLTLSIGGLQIAWSVELSNGSPYLLSLGMNKSLLAIVWIAGPLSGTLVQPYVGIRSDNCRISWGKRKPFMLAGTAATILSLLALAWTREIVGGICGVFGADPQSYGVRTAAICFAVLFVYILDFSINTVQAGIRAFMVDNAPAHQQESVNAWGGRMTGIGSVLGYLSGYVNLPKLVPLLGNTQFKVLCIIACLALGSTVVISSLYIKERDPRLEGPPAVEKPGVLPFFRQVFLSIKRLPSQIRKVCDAQFFNWIGWFPFLFYISTYVGQIYVNPFLEDNPNMAPEEINALWERATRQGTFSLLIFAITSFTSNMLLPFLVAPSYQAPRLQPRVFVGSPTVRNRPTTPSTPGGMTSTMTSFFPPTPSPKSPSRLTRLLDACQIRWLTLRRAWLLSHILFAFCMFLTFFVRSTAAATAVVGLVGISWAMTLWAPFALISAEVSKRDAARRSRIAGRGNGEEFYARADDESEDQAGIILGLHNVAIAAPQVIATLASSLIFKMIQKPRGETGDDSVGWVLRFGGGAALIAAYMTSRIEEEWDLKKGDGGGGEVGDDVSV